MMTSIKSIFTYLNLPDTEIDDQWIEEYASQAVDLIGVDKAYERDVCLLTVSNHRASLPRDLKYIEAVSYQYRKPSPSEVTKLTESLSSSVTETVENDGTRTITNTLTTMFTTPGEYTNNQEHIVRIQHQGVLNTYQIWMDSSLYSNNFTLMKMINRPFSSNFHCDNCPNYHCECEEVYSITPDRVLQTSLETGNICISYLKRAVNDCGDIMIPDDDDFKRALAAYVQMRYANEKMWMHEDNMFRLYYEFRKEWELLSSKVRGKFIMKYADLDSIAIANKPLAGLIRSNSAFDNLNQY